MSRRFGQPAYHFEETDTTMREAAELARNGCPEGAIVTAARQTAGRGRLGRRWLSEPDGGLYLSLVLRPDVAPGAAPLLTLVAGLGAAEAVRAATGLDCDIRWPNDIMIRGRKCAGILVEMETREERVTHAVVGIGLNLNYREFGADLADSATSLLLETGRRHEADAVLQPLLDALRDSYEIYLQQGKEPVLEAFAKASSYVSGRRVVVTGGGGRAADRRGVTAGLDADGMLLLRDAAGRVEPISAGSVRLDERGRRSDAAGG